MRIITGCARGTKLKTPKGLSTRPTADRVKESLFSILGNRLEGAHVLDLFAGTGALGLEALSRGAASAVLVDASTSILIKQNASAAKLTDKVEVIGADCLRFLRRMAHEQRRFDMIFCDPPYNQGYPAAVLAWLDKKPILTDVGILILEHSHHEPVSDDSLERLQIVRREKYGETVVAFFRYK